MRSGNEWLTGVRNAAVAASFFLGAGLTPLAAQSIQMTTEYQQAQQLVAQSNFEGALSALQPLLSQPNLAGVAKVELGRIRQKQAESEMAMALAHFNEAGTYFQAGIDEGGLKGTEAPKVLYDLARIYEERMSDFPKAAVAYEKIIADYPNFLSIDKVTFYLAGCHEKTGRREEAATMYRTIVEKYPYSSFFQVAQQKMKSLSAGTAVAGAAIDAQQGVVENARTDAQAAKAALDLAAMHANQGGTKQAIEEYRKIAADHAGTDFARQAMARMSALLDKDRDYKGAAETLEEMVKQFPNEPGMEKNLLKLGRIYEENIQDLKTRTRDGQVMYKKGGESTQKAIEYYDKITESYPDADVSADAFLRKADLYRTRLKDYDEAKKQYQDFLKRFPDHQEADTVRERLKNIENGDSGD